MAHLRQAIVTKYLGPTDSRGARVKASAEAGSVSVPWDYELDAADNHIAAAEKYAQKYGWDGAWFGGGTKDGYVFVNAVEQAFQVTTR